MASTPYSRSQHTIFSGSGLNPSPLITIPVADLFLGNPIRNRCLVPIPDMFEAAAGASTTLTPRKRTIRKASLASSMLQGFYTSQDELMDASTGDDIDSDDSEEDCGLEGEEMEVAGWMVLSPSKRRLRRSLSPKYPGGFNTAEGRSDEESEDEPLADEDVTLERMKRSRVGKGKTKAMDEGSTIHPLTNDTNTEPTKVRPLAPLAASNRTWVSEM